jgi:EAL domain-containing protein (putative c-di-GMP-specific phosphodiesterase class I)
LDDFGTGMSSYSYLKNLPVDYLKIDGIFIKDILNNQNDYAVVKSVTEIGHFMDKLVVAEFVQDDESAALLKEIGVDYLQGFGISRPHKLDDLLQ